MNFHFFTKIFRLGLLSPSFLILGVQESWSNDKIDPDQKDLQRLLTILPY